MPTQSFIVNGKPISVDCDDDVRLLWVLRDLLGITGPKYGCGLDVCRVRQAIIAGAAKMAQAPARTGSAATRSGHHPVVPSPRLR